MADDDDGPDLSCFDFADSGDEQESREDLLKRHKEEVQQLRAEAKARKKAIDKADKAARAACEDEFTEALQEMEARHAKELGGGDAAAAESMAALAVSESKQSKGAKRRQKKEQEEREREQRIADEKAGAGPSQREVEMEELERQLKPLGRRIVDIQADGHCLYRAVAHQLQQHGDGMDDDYVGCRRLAAGYMRSHPSDFLPFVAAEGTDLGAYTQKVESSNEWGGALPAPPALDRSP